MSDSDHIPPGMFRYCSRCGGGHTCRATARDFTCEACGGPAEPEQTATEIRNHVASTLAARLPRLWWTQEPSP